MKLFFIDRNRQSIINSRDIDNEDIPAINKMIKLLKDMQVLDGRYRDLEICDEVHYAYDENGIGVLDFITWDDKARLVAMKLQLKTVKSAVEWKILETKITELEKKIEKENLVRKTR